MYFQETGINIWHLFHNTGIKEITMERAKLVEKVKFVLEQAMKAQRGSRDVVLHFL
jgi:hypothetical protein